ncbi:response regulator [Limobrevibacterium gyesilva]|uniref:Response regulator n=1 Tax=Limobrevibacterium gyesilva TaxID=2991712 RepID=A0AA41YJU8_9PROT|nr:response regulator [Limobrevibacterium gyesilva]MCW3474534.1 response regulator [Limobrevibacterium gyesilva]
MNARPRILLVDDDPAVLELAAEVLDGAGFDVTTASNGMAALEKLQSGERFAALVTDHAMPGLPGDDLVSQANKIAPGMPCLLVTGYGDAGETAAGVHVLRKPYRAAELSGTVQALIEARPGESPGGF